MSRAFRRIRAVWRRRLKRGRERRRQRGRELPFQIFSLIIRHAAFYTMPPLLGAVVLFAADIAFDAIFYAISRCRAAIFARAARHASSRFHDDLRR